MLLEIFNKGNTLKGKQETEVSVARRVRTVHRCRHCVPGESARSLGQVRDGAQDCTCNVDVGTPCRDVRLLWYYNEKGGNCDHFFYGGCDGNDNRYFTQGICELYCMSKLSPGFVCFYIQ